MIKVYNKLIGENQPCFLIAEAGVNHDGDIMKAKELIDIAKDAGVDAVKFQTWITEELKLKDTEKAQYQKEQTGADESQFDMSKKLELSYEDFRELKKYCDEKGIMFLTTPDEIKSANFIVKELKVPAIKVGSGEITNLFYLKQLASYNLPMIVSTGTATLEQVKRAKRAIGNCDKIVFLHCTTDYPAKYTDTNLNAMLTLKKELGTFIGYSDHTEGIVVSLAARALGAVVIEKHFTYDKNAFGPDHKASLSPEELKEWVRSIRVLEEESSESRISIVKDKLYNTILGSSEKKPVDREKANIPVIQKSVVSAEDIPAGTELTEELITTKRANCKGFAADQYKEVIGKKTKQSLKKDTVILPEYLE